MLRMLKHKTGFTLIEILAALAIFSIVATIAAGATVAISNVNRKSQAIKLALDNLNFALESMALNLSRGANYTCLDSVDTPSVIPDGFTGLDCEGVAFDAFLDKNDPEAETPRAYLFDTVNVDGTNAGVIKYWRNLNTSDPAGVITSARDINIKVFQFDVHSGDFGSPKPYVVVRLEGVVAENSRYKTEFALRSAFVSRGGGF